MTDYRYEWDGMTKDEMRAKMEKGWRSSETPCGCGSELAHTELIRKWLPRACARYGIQSINDAGAGDLNWITSVAWLPPQHAPAPDRQLWGMKYRGFDLVPRHPSVEQFDITERVLPCADAILCRHVLNHLSPELARTALGNFVESGSRYLFVTNCENQVNYWKEHGMALVAPIEQWDDATKWWVELHDLHQPIWRT